MKKEDIRLNDLHRILFGEAPPVFLLETFIRTILTYAVLLLILRWLGKRMAGQLSITEMAVMLMLGAIVGAAFQIPERGILLCVFMLFVILALHQALTLFTSRVPRVEHWVQGKASLMVADGVLQLEEMRKTRISQQQLLAVLRCEEVHSLGQIERLYLEACGLFSVFRYAEPRPGLPTAPPADPAVKTEQEQKTEGLMACTQCGYTNKARAGDTCINCGQHQWTKAVL